MALRVALVALLAAVGVFGYLPHDAGPKENFISDALLREVVDRMGKDLADAADTYLDFSGPDPRLSLMARANKDLESEQFDYDSLTDGSPNPSLRDQEYLQHSTLWGQYLNGVSSEDNQRIHSSGINRPIAPAIKADTALPAYCNPPNPCPVGYNEEHGCITNFENTAAFSREYQAEQECMCDGEHMFDCPGGNGGGGSSGGLARSDSGLDRFLAQQFSRLQINEHKSLVAKKYHAKKSANPYLSGEKLPVAAKKGINVDTEFE